VPGLREVPRPDPDRAADLLVAPALGGAACGAGVQDAGASPARPSEPTFRHRCGVANAPRGSAP
jgi:hypothetical protein